MAIYYLNTDKSIAYDSSELVPPAPYHGSFFAKVIGMREAQTGRDAGQVSQIENIVKFRRCWWQLYYQNLRKNALNNFWILELWLQHSY